MGSFLIDAWLDGAQATPMLDAASVSLVRREVRERSAALELPEVVTGRLVNIASELGHNQLAHARGGVIALRALERDGVAGLEVIAADRGPGIRAPSTALRGIPRVPESSDPALRTSLGVGLAALLEHADESDFDVRLGEGTCVWARKFARPVARRREIGMYGVPYPDELASGDDAVFVRDRDQLLIGLADGLGHGPHARVAARGAVEALREQRAAPLQEILARAHDALQTTRGAVMACVRVDEAAGELESANVGNVSVRLCGPQLHKHFSGRSFVLGSPGNLRSPLMERAALGPRDALILFSDGVTSRMNLENELDLLREHPLVIAHQFVERFGRGNDDMLVLVAR